MVPGSDWDGLRNVAGYLGVLPPTVLVLTPINVTSIASIPSEPANIPMHLGPNSTHRYASYHRYAARLSTRACRALRDARNDALAPNCAARAAWKRPRKPHAALSEVGRNRDKRRVSVAPDVTT